MLSITSIDESAELFKALGSDIRMEIVRLLLSNKSMSMHELATALCITDGALTSHIKKLESCGLIRTTNDTSGHGNKKMCSLVHRKLLFDFDTDISAENTYKIALPIGQCNDYQVFPTCGLASNTAIIGEVDDPRFFSHPDHTLASIIWFTKGYVDYDIPNLIPGGQKITQLMLTMELSSEAPGFNNVWPSDISFYLNDTLLGVWTSPGDFGDTRGIYTPEWWYENWNQYGLLKMLVINGNGTFLDGLLISDTTIDSLALNSDSKLKLRLAVEAEAKHVGGLTVFGKGFGNYDQDIEITINYLPINT